jgi:hypothetical protein
LLLLVLAVSAPMLRVLAKLPTLELTTTILATLAVFFQRASTEA